MVHLATRRREWEKDRRAERIRYLIACFRTRMRDLDGEDDESKARFDAAIEDMTLFGSAEQVHLARKVRHFRNSGMGIQYGPLLQSLRDELGRELGLKPIRCCRLEVRRRHGVCGIGRPRTSVAVP